MQPNPSDSPQASSTTAAGRPESSRSAPGSAEAAPDKLTVWLIDKILEEILNDREPSRDIAVCLNKRPAVDLIRDRAREQHVQPVLGIIARSSESAVRSLMVSILRRFTKLSEVQEFFLATWRRLSDKARTIAECEPSRSDKRWQDWKTQEDEIYRERHNLMWRIADFREASLRRHGLLARWQEFQPEAFALVKSDWERFFHVQEIYTGGAYSGDRSKFKAFFEKRVGVPEDERPHTGLWLYLCLAWGAPEVELEWMREKLGTYSAINDPTLAFVKRVARELNAPGTLRPITLSILGTRDHALLTTQQALSNDLLGERQSRAASNDTNRSLCETRRRLFFGFQVFQFEVMPRNLLSEYSTGKIEKAQLLTELLQLPQDEQLVIPENFHKHISIGQEATWPEQSCDSVKTMASAPSRSPSIYPEAVWNLKNGGFAKTSDRINHKLTKLRGKFALSLTKAKSSKLWLDSIKANEKISDALPSGEEKKNSDQRVDRKILHHMTAVHDGEFTFYSLLWGLRHLANGYKIVPSKLADTIKQSQPKDTKLPLQFDGDQWQSVSVNDWLSFLGLRYDEGGTRAPVATRRWWTFWEWLTTLCDKTANADNRDDRAGISKEANALAEIVSNDFDRVSAVKSFHMPMKTWLPQSDYSSASGVSEGRLLGDWADLLWSFATNFQPGEIGSEPPEPTDGLICLLREPSFQELIENNAASASGGGASTVGNADEEDVAINTAFRAIYFPAEFLLRQCQPYPLHLLTIPVNNFHASWLDRQDNAHSVAPFAFVFFTLIKEREPPSFNWRNDAPDRLKRRDDELLSYCQLASLLAGPVSAYATGEAVTDFWRQGLTQAFANLGHDIKNMGSAIRNRAMMDVNLPQRDCLAKVATQSEDLHRLMPWLRDPGVPWAIIPAPDMLRDIARTISIWSQPSDMSEYIPGVINSNAMPCVANEGAPRPLNLDDLVLSAFEHARCSLAAQICGKLGWHQDQFTFLHRSYTSIKEYLSKFTATFLENWLGLNGTLRRSDGAFAFVARRGLNGTSHFLLSRIFLLLVAHAKDCFLHGTPDETSSKLTLALTEATSPRHLLLEMRTACRDGRGSQYESLKVIEETFWDRFTPMTDVTDFDKAAMAAIVRYTTEKRTDGTRRDSSITGRVIKEYLCRQADGRLSVDTQFINGREYYVLGAQFPFDSP